jgi:hypothetical protein
MLTQNKLSVKNERAEDKMYRIVGQTFRDHFIDLDFVHWESCSFINCTIHSSYGIFKLIGNDFSKCKLSLGGPAETIARLIREFFPDKPISFESEPPTS